MSTRSTLALVWLFAWSLGARGCWRDAARLSAEADRLGLPCTGLEPGADVRVEGHIADWPKVRSPLTHTEGAAVLVEVYYTTTYPTFPGTGGDARLIFQRWIGPASIRIEVGENWFELPLSRWIPDRDMCNATFTDVESLPSGLQIPSADVQRAKDQTQGFFQYFRVRESVLAGGAPVFVAGHLEPRTPEIGKLRIAPDRVLRRIVVYCGTQEEVVAQRRDHSSAVRVVAWVVLALGILPALILAALFIRRSSGMRIARTRR